MSGYPGGHAGFLLVTLATHALVGYTLGKLVVDSPRAGLVGGVLADVDLLVPAAVGPPLAHRGVTHTPLAALVVVAVTWALTRRTGVTVAVGLGYASQLLIDATTAQGIPAGFPLWDEHVGIALGTHSWSATALLWVLCLGALWSVDRRRQESPVGS